jgi:hypothetical protein
MFMTTTEKEFNKRMESAGWTREESIKREYIEFTKFLWNNDITGNMSDTTLLVMESMLQEKEKNYWRCMSSAVILWI